MLLCVKKKFKKDILKIYFQKETWVFLWIKFIKEVVSLLLKCFILEPPSKQNVKIGFCNISIWKELPFLSQQFSHKEYEMSY